MSPAVLQDKGCIFAYDCFTEQDGTSSSVSLHFVEQSNCKIYLRNILCCSWYPL